MRLSCDSSYGASDLPTLSDAKSPANIVPSVVTIFQITSKQTEQQWTQDRVLDDPGHNVLLWWEQTMYSYSLFSIFQVVFKPQVPFIFYVMTAKFL